MSSARVGCLLLPGFSLGTLAGLTDTLATAGVLLPGQTPEPLLLSLDGRPVRAAAGAWVVAGELRAAPPLQLAVVVADGPWEDGLVHQSRVLDWLRAQAAAGAALGGVGSGALWLAEAGLLDGHRATVHWPHLAQLAERHPALVPSQQRFEIDRGRLSSANGDAARDLMIAWLGQRHGERLAQELAAQAGLPALRSQDDRQRLPGGGRGTGSAKLAEALALMEANLAEPLPTEEVARLVGVSRRHLERLFRQHLDALPSRWYLTRRLERAQALLRQTPQSILQIGLACGFASGPHFSNAYRAHFGRTPREERGVRAQAWRAATPSAADPGAPAPARVPPADDAVR